MHDITVYYGSNPLNPKMELTEAGWKILDLKVSLNYVIDEYISCEVDRRWEGGTQPDNAAYRIRPASTAEDVIHRMSFLNELCDGKDVTDISIAQKYMRENAETPHSGDCLKQPAACTRCYLEDFLGINTLLGTGFSEGPQTEGMLQYFCTEKIYQICDPLYDNFVMKEKQLDELEATGVFREYLNDYRVCLYGKTFHADIPVKFWR